MKKIKTVKGSDLIVKYVIKAVILTFISVFLWSAFLSLICLKLDIDISILKILSIAVCALTSAFTGYFSVKGFKNNGFALGAISALPLIIYSFINLIFHSSGGIFFLVKLFICIIIGGIFGFLSINNSKRIKVK